MPLKGSNSGAIAEYIDERSRYGHVLFCYTELGDFSVVAHNDSIPMHIGCIWIVFELQGVYSWCIYMIPAISISDSMEIPSGGIQLCSTVDQTCMYII